MFVPPNMKSRGNESKAKLRPPTPPKNFGEKSVVWKTVSGEGQSVENVGPDASETEVSDAETTYVDKDGNPLTREQIEQMKRAHEARKAYRANIRSRREAKKSAQSSFDEAEPPKKKKKKKNVEKDDFIVGDVHVRKLEDEYLNLDLNLE